MAYFETAWPETVNPGGPVHVQESTDGKATGRQGPGDTVNRDSWRVTLRPWQLSAEDPAPFAPNTQFPAAFQVNAWHKQGQIPLRSL